ncbi:UV-endonuclease UvdE [Cadophora sp. DSE1049]|nr:UV-endonuclease UvdE [Cadophora sp. DSE1049]
MPPKRKRSTAPAEEVALNGVHESPILPSSTPTAPPLKKRVSRRGKVDTNPDHNADIVDGKYALRASPDADEKGEAFDAGSLAKVAPDSAPAPVTAAKINGAMKKETGDELPNGTETPAKKQKKSPTKSSVAAKKGSDEIKAFRAQQAAKKAAEVKVKKEEDVDEWDKRLDPDGDEEGPAEDVDAIKLEARRPPPVNSDYLPLPWKGRLGYACLNTYLRSCNPPIFTSRTCRIASILEHRHPLKDPSQPEHATKNRPDKAQPASIERGQRYIEELCLANIRDIPKMLRWNDKYGIKFMRQFTQLGSPRAEVIANAIRDLDYHDEMLSLLQLPEQANRDAVMILHMGGTFGDKSATLERFKTNYTSLSPSIKARLVLENDDVSWSVHDLLPVCEELNIPLCLDFHHHNIIFSASHLREGTHDITALYPRIKATWDRKNITQKMHYSEPCPEAITGRQRRKHNPRPITLPPCPNDMDLMIEAKDKEQAVFELMRTFKLPGWETFNNIVPFERDDDNRPLPKKAKKKKTKKQIEAEIEEFGQEVEDEDEVIKDVIPDEEIGMGGQENRVYWPLGMEEWLRPKKREVGKKNKVGDEEMFRNPTPANFKARQEITKRNRMPLNEEYKGKLADAKSVEDVKRVLDEIKEQEVAVEDAEGEKANPAAKVKNAKTAAAATPSKKATPSSKPKSTAKSSTKKSKGAPTPSLSNMDDEESEELSLPELSDEDESAEEERMKKPVLKRAASSRQSERAKGKRMSYAEDEEDDKM